MTATGVRHTEKPLMQIIYSIMMGQLILSGGAYVGNFPAIIRH